MPDWLYITILFGIGPAIGLGVVGLYYWNRRREDREAWERGQALRRQLREQQAARGVETCAGCGATAAQTHKDGCHLDGSHYLGRAPLPGEVTVTTCPVESHCRVQEIPLTDEQRKLLTVSREVSIPGAGGNDGGVMEVPDGRD